MALAIACGGCGDPPTSPSHGEPAPTETPLLRVAPLPRVATVSELRLSQAFEFPEQAGRAWLGIERTRITEGESLLIYALQEGHLEPASGPDVVGAWRVELTPLEGRAQLCKEHESLLEAQAVTRGPQLYAHAVGGLEAGRYRIALSAGSYVASTELIVEQGPTHPWTALRSDQLAELEPLRDTGTLHASRSGPGEHAQPHVSGVYPLFPLPTERLPSLASPEPTLRARLVQTRGAQIHLEVNAAHSVADLTGTLLARWWVNGRAYVPAASRQLTDSLRKQCALSEVRRFELSLDVDVVALGARPGDWIEIQLMHCPDGLNYGASQLRLRQGGSERGLPEVSQRVGFVYAGTHPSAGAGVD